MGCAASAHFFGPGAGRSRPDVSSGLMRRSRGDFFVLLQSRLRCAQPRRVGKDIQLRVKRLLARRFSGVMRSRRNLGLSKPGPNLRCRRGGTVAAADLGKRIFWPHALQWTADADLGIRDRRMRYSLKHVGQRISRMACRSQESASGAECWRLPDNMAMPSFTG
jgi:hypothetical protein